MALILRVNKQQQQPWQSLWLSKSPKYGQILNYEIKSIQCLRVVVTSFKHNSKQKLPISSITKLIPNYQVEISISNNLNAQHDGVKSSQLI